MKINTNQERLNQLFDSDPRTDTAIADVLGVSKQTISMWRHGTRSPKKSVLIRISEIFGVSIEWLMGFDVEKDNSRPSVPIFIPEPNDDAAISRLPAVLYIALRIIKRLPRRGAVGHLIPRASFLHFVNTSRSIE